MSHKKTLAFGAVVISLAAATVRAARMPKNPPESVL